MLGKIQKENVNSKTTILFFPVFNAKRKKSPKQKILKENQNSPTKMKMLKVKNQPSPILSVPQTPHPTFLVKKL